MKKILWISGAAALLVFSGCSEQSKEEVKKSSQRVEENVVKATETVKAKAGEKMQEAKRVAAEAVERVKANSKKMEKDVREMTAESAAVEKGGAELKEKTDKPAAQNAPSTGDGATLYVKCAGCHGSDGKTKALGKSAIIAGQSADELKKKLDAYKAGNRNVSGMGALMQGQVASLDENQIAVLADYIARMK